MSVSEYSASVPHKYFAIDGVATYLHHTGATTLPELPPDTSQGEVVLCLHGTGGNGCDFERVLEALATDHSPIAFDQPGHGRSGGLDSLGAVDRMCDFTLALTSKLGLRPRVLVGHSLGAAVAIECALEAPAEVRGLVMLSAGASFAFPPELLENARLVTEGKRRRSFDPAAFSSESKPEIMRAAFMAGMKTDPRATYGDLVACTRWSRSEELAKITVPALVLHGDAEREEVVAQADRLVELLPNARKRVIAKAGQMILHEQPDAVGEAIVDFLSELP